jgi:carbonic anhydrase
MKTLTGLVARLGLAIAVLVVAGAGAIGSNDAPALKPEVIVQRLMDGNARFAAGKSSHLHADAARREDTTKNGQRPIATVLSCSDSRAPVEVLFDQGVGDVFVVRVAGNVCNTDEIGSIEYGVDHLGTPIMVVLGHTHCGAVTAIATSAELHGSIPSLVKNIRSAVAKAQRENPDLHGKDLVPSAIEANVWQSIDDLLKNSSAVRARAKAGQVKVLGAIYDLQCGQVRWLGEHPEMKRLLEYQGGAGHHDSMGHTPSESAGHADGAGPHGHPSSAAENPMQAATDRTNHPSDAQSVDTGAQDVPAAASTQRGRKLLVVCAAIVAFVASVVVVWKSGVLQDVNAPE